ncbi:hypothetical protein DERP_005175 [Dermatophagoides pteronyssinus]|uniref:Uncharacterized protein n=1 Tax=Dermatophagoides pteronyssinus TaxID=6956 RepID=A0ABQ8JMM0_DERPT|nr:hypothetical protein DERP_005175 [Dermatophagoides pteronyssinus]
MNCRWTCTPPTTIRFVSERVILSRKSSISSNGVSTEFSPIINCIGHDNSRIVSPNSPRLPLIVFNGNPKQTIAAIERGFCNAQCTASTDAELNPINTTGLDE